MLFRGKRKSKGVGEWFYLLIKQCVHVYMHVIFVLTFCLFVVKNFYVLEFNNCVCKFDKNKNENLFKKKKSMDSLTSKCHNSFQSKNNRKPHVVLLPDL